MATSKEAQFQKDIITAMTAQGWLTGPASGYDRAAALYTEDFLGYFKDAWPERWDKFAKANPNNPDGVLVQRLVRELEQGGTLDVLRHGFKLPGVKIEACSFKPDHGMNPDTLKRYQCNRLRVVPEVSYSPNACNDPLVSAHPTLLMPGVLGVPHSLTTDAAAVRCSTGSIG